MIMFAVISYFKSILKFNGPTVLHTTIDLYCSVLVFVLF